jgi:hypothetical protein
MVSSQISYCCIKFLHNNPIHYKVLAYKCKHSRRARHRSCYSCTVCTKWTLMNINTVWATFAWRRTVCSFSPWPRAGNTGTHIIVFSSSTVLVSTLGASHRRFLNLIKTLCRTPLDELSARRKGLYLHRTTHTHAQKHKDKLRGDSKPWSQ